MSVEKSVESVHKGGVTWLDLDGIEHRWLLAAAADASVAVYDIQACVMSPIPSIHPFVARAGCCGLIEAHLLVHKEHRTWTVYHIDSQKD